MLHTTRRLRSWRALAAISLASVLVSCSPARDSSAHARAASDVIAEGSLESQLQNLREEEKLARDVYLTLHQRWGVPIFDNIASAEQRHMDRIGAILAARRIPDPVIDNTVGVFQSETFRALYQELVERGSISLLDALQVGATIEDLDLKDLAELRARLGDQDADILATVDVLACGSRNHMRAFSRQLDSRGAHYTPQYIDEEQYASILASAHERCGAGPGMGGGAGRGMGGGAGQGPPDEAW